jgi:hypothetical protein
VSTGHQSGVCRTPDSKAFDPNAIDSDLSDDIEKGNLTSVSSSTSDLERVLRAFEQSPVTTGKAKLCDRATARELLKQFTPEVIEYGILLAGARRTNSFHTLDLAGQEKSQAKVQTLAYFANAIQEVATDPNMTASYAQYLRHKLRQFAELKKEPQRAAE